MHFRKNIFLPFLVLSLLIFLVAQVNPPYLYLDKSYAYGLELKSEVLGLRTQLMDKAGVDVEEYESIEKQLTKIDTRLDKIIDDGRPRHYGYSRLRCNIFALSILISGLILTIILSWRKDVNRLKNQSDETNKNG